MKLAQLVAEGAIVPRIASPDRDGAIAELIDAIIASGRAKPDMRDELINHVLERESRGTTGFGKGVAVPHIKHPNLGTICAAVGVSERGIDFRAMDKQRVYAVFLLISPIDRPEEHLQAMEIIFKNLSKDIFRRFLRQAQTAQDIRTLLEEADNQLLAG